MFFAMEMKMDKLAYFDPPDLREEVAPPPSLGDFWKDIMSLLDTYCERSAVGWWQEPLNTWSSLLFLLAAFVGFWLCRRRLATGSAKDRTRSTLCLDLSAIGISSWLFHASGWALFAPLNILAILVFTIRASFALLTRGLALKGLQASLAVVAIFALAPLLSFLPLVGDFFSYSFNLQGGIFYLSPILTLGLVVLMMLYRAKRPSKAHGKDQSKGHGKAQRQSSADLSRSAAGLGIACAVLAASLTLRTLDMPLCAEWQSGTHFLWHTLNALALFLVVVCLPKQTAKT